MGQVKTPDDYNALAQSRGYSWIGPFPKNTKCQTWWECQEGHRWSAKYNSIHNGNACPYCASNGRKLEKDYLALASLRSIEWLGPLPVNANTLTKWRCKNGHVWGSKYATIYMGKGCPHCAGNARRVAEDYRQIAKINGVEWLGPMPSGVNEKTRWRCASGHEWVTTYYRISAGHGCPDCKRSKGEDRVSEVLHNLGITHEKQKRFAECRDKKPLPFDFCFVWNGRKYLCEYHGEQHYRASHNSFFDKKSGLQNRQRRDEVKASWAKSNGYEMIVIAYTDFDKIEEIIRDELQIGQ